MLPFPDYVFGSRLVPSDGLLHSRARLNKNSCKCIIEMQLLNSLFAFHYSFYLCAALSLTIVESDWTERFGIVNHHSPQTIANSQRTNKIKVYGFLFFWFILLVFTFFSLDGRPWIFFIVVFVSFILDDRTYFFVYFDLWIQGIY